jgi:hypothetical protein
MHPAAIRERLVLTMNERNELSFPQDTLFYRLDGVLFAVLPNQGSIGVDDKGQLISVTSHYAEELARMVDLWELVEEEEFRLALGKGCRLPEKHLKERL